MPSAPASSTSTTLNLHFHHLHYRQCVAQLFPPDFDFSDVEESEQRVIKHFLTQFDDSWYVVPSVPIVVDKQDSEIDIILVSADSGIFVVEVKGGIITSDGDRWKSNGRNIKKNPFTQITNAKHELLKRVKEMKVDLNGLFIQHLVAFPDIITFPDEGAGPGVPRNIVFTQSELENADHYMQLVATHIHPINEEQLTTLLRALKPSVSEIEVTGKYITGTSQRIDKASLNELRLLFDLDENKRILLRGRAGTGKTFLAHNWAWRSLRRGERTLLICYNRALGQDLYAGFADFIEQNENQNQIRVGSFHSIANALLGNNQVAVPPSASQDFWRDEHVKALRNHINEIEERFDTIIIDEGQDFYDSWISILEDLLVDKDNSRFYVTIDESQAIFREPPAIPGSPVLFRLNRNVRSTRNVAKVARSLGGAIVPKNAPVGPAVEKHVVRGMKEARKHLKTCLDHAVESLHVPHSQVLVLAPHKDDIDQLIADQPADYTLVRWQDRAEGEIACATMAAVKGLERLAVIVISLDNEVKQDVSYVALTRASAYLAVIGTDQFLQSIGLVPTPVENKKSDSESITD